MLDDGAVLDDVAGPDPAFVSRAVDTGFDRTAGETGLRFRSGGPGEMAALAARFVDALLANTFEGGPGGDRAGLGDGSLGRADAGDGLFLAG